MSNIEMPNNWDCYKHQRPLWSYLDQKDDKGQPLPGLRAVEVWHRRAGKDSTVLNFTATEAAEVVGTYYHFLPTQRQARKVIWDGIDKQGRSMINQAFPEGIREHPRSQDMQIPLKNGSMWQCLGSDNYDSIVGTNPRGVIFSEWSICNPLAWDYIRPILAENGGWAVFIFTARGKNHGYTLSEMARKNPKWHHSILTVEDTERPDGTRIISEEAIQDERDAGMSEDMVQQEFYCSFDVAIPGAYFALEVAATRADGRIKFIPIEPHLDVHTFWDLGLSKGNEMCVWFVQALGEEIRIINCYSGPTGQGMPHYMKYLDTFAKEHNIVYGEHFAPHDMNVAELMNGKSRVATAKEMGYSFRVVPRTNDLNDSIEATRRLFSRCFFDETRCEIGIGALASYHRLKDGDKVNPDGTPVFQDKPDHDWTSNYADSFRQIAQGWHRRLSLKKRPPSTAVQAPHNFNVFE